MTVTVVKDKVQLVTVYGGPRGAQGTTGAGVAGPQGPGFRLLGAWNGTTAYVSGDAVTSRSSTSPDASVLWILNDGANPTTGVQPYLEPGLWSEIGGVPGEATLGAATRVSQSSHNFTQRGEPVAFSMATGRFEVANCRSADFLSIGVITDIVDGDEFVVQFSGRLDNISPNLINGVTTWEVGRIYYLSDGIGLYQIGDPSLEGWLSQPCVMPIAKGGAVGAPADIVLLTWGADNLSPAAVTGSAPPINAGVGSLWFRTDASPGLYVRLPDISGVSLVWVQANG